ncbi:MAG: class I SAM-dependent methyltransferase [Candidatus Omnitrophica bacterium]|nr:class I SAM-dependent methyltransferase [Candidatus Omnitrophota bacterium]
MTRRISGIFDKYYKKYDAWYDKHAFAFLSELEAIKKVLPKKGKGLEIGVGTGRFAASLGIQFGIDPSERMLAISKARGIKVKSAAGEKLPFNDSVFDYVALIITLCFVKDPLQTLNEARRVLKKKGKIIIGIIDKDSFLGRLYRKKKSLFYKEANFLGVKEITDYLKASGFGRVSYYQTIFKLPDRINSVEKPEAGYGKGAFVVIGAQKGFQK